MPSAFKIKSGNGDDMREEIRREHEARGFMLELARETYPWKVTAYKNKVKMMRRKMKLPEDAVTARLIELGGMDFLVKGAESMGRSRCADSGTILAAVRALELYLDPDGAAMFSWGGDAARDEV
jgi:hypothetical protein